MYYTSQFPCPSTGAHLPVPAYDIFIRGQFLKPHRPSGMKLLRTDADLCPKTELKAVGKPGRSIPIDAGRVHLP